MIKLGLEIGAIYVMQYGDAVLVGHAGAGLYGDHADSILLTFSSGPNNANNDLEVLIPRQAWSAFKDALASDEGGMYRLSS